MKRASFTLFQPQSWMSKLGQSALMVLFVWCCLGLANVNAQTDVVRITDDGKATNTVNTKKLTTCNGTVTKDSGTQFTDDGNNDGNYNDPNTVGPIGRIDTAEFCPKDQWSRVKVVFTKFDLAPGDTLFVYDGDRKAVRGGLAPGTGSGATAGSSGPSNGTGSGVGVSSAFGGWVDASCDPAVNPTGCLTFIFRTNGDNIKGAGWDAWVDCADRGINLTAKPSVASAKLVCADSAFAPITINHPGFAKAPPCTVSDTVLITVKNQRGVICPGFNKRKVVTGSSIMGNFAIGIYTVEYVLNSDAKKTTAASFSVQAPSLVCNDDVIVPLGSACEIQLTPDDLLENPCDTSDFQGFMYYNITVRLGNGKVVKTTTGHDNLGAVTYPVITMKDITDAGMKVCGGTATVTVERIFYGDRNGDNNPDYPFGGGMLCTNGIQNASCETTLSFEDQSAPFISIATNADTLVACDTTGLARLLNIRGIDNCTETVPVTYTVDMSSTDPCDTSQITVNFTAVDDCGNVGRQSRTFTLIRPSTFVTYTERARDCKATNNDTRVPGMQIGTIKNGLFTLRDTVDLSTTDYTCGYLLTKRDIEIPATDCGRKIYRYWNVIDWCVPGQGPTALDTTFIEFTDNVKPFFVDTLDKRVTLELVSGAKINNAKRIKTDLKVALGAFECTFDASKFTRPVAVDNCDPAVDVNITAIWSIEKGKLWPITDRTQWATLACGDYFVLWNADDQCHEQNIDDNAYQMVSIQDVTKPSAICTDQLNVSVPSDGGARIRWEDIDAGSVDACGIDSIRIRRKGTTDPWREFVDVLCTDVHVGLQIEMRVWDKNSTNFNTCWMDVTAEDKIPPVCADLPPMTFNCDEFHNGEFGVDTKGEFVALTGDLLTQYNTRFGNPNCTDNLSCGILEVKQEYRLTEKACGQLTIERRYSATDWDKSSAGSNTATQLITVNYVPKWKLTFPADVDVTCQGTFPDAATAAQIVSNGSCDLWALEVTDKVFEVPGDICMKIERTYELINWCVYQAGDAGITVARTAAGDGAMIDSEGNTTVGRVTYTQILKLYVNDAPTITINPVETCIYGEGDLAPFGAADNSPNAAPFECDTVKTFSASAVNCAGVALASDNFTWKFFVNGTEVSKGTGSSFSQAVSPSTKYKVEFWVSDGCGNSAGDDMEVEFMDCKKPTPYVLNGLAISIMQTGSIQLWANDLDQGSYDNCTPKNKLDTRIFAGDPTQGPQDLAGVRALSKNVTFTCTELGTQSVSFYVIDEKGNWDVVGTYVLVQNNMGACEGINVVDGSVSGKVVSALGGENVELVNVSVNGGDNAMTTGATGTYDFILATGGDYTITPEKNVSPLNGVSTYDLVLISKHILGIDKFDSPYKYIAADVNKSGSITAFDMVQLRQLILNITSEFSNNTSWRFVDSKHEFTSENPAAENFNEFMTINNLEGSMLDVDFVGVKVGDINGNAASNSLLGAETRSTNGALSLTANDRFVEAGQTVTVDFTAADIATTQGYQFTMNFAGLDLVELNEGVAKAANFNTSMAKRGVITTSWNGEATADEVLFSLTLTANTNGLLSELVSVSSDLTAAEAYNTAGDLMDVKLDFNASAVSAEFALKQNTPNPFNGETLVGFNLPQAGTATLKVMDAQGKVLKVITQEGTKGANQITLDAKSLGATGVLYYQLESSDNIATKKMIIIE